MSIHTRSSTDKWDGNTYDLKVIGNGVSGLILEIDETRVIKIPHGDPRSRKDIVIEREAYRRFHSRPSQHVVDCIDFEDPRGLILEHMGDSMRQRLHRKDQTPTKTQIRNWAVDAAKGLAFLHSHRIVQGDVGCHNMLLDARDCLKLCDFSGSSIDGAESTVDYETRSQYPYENIAPNRRTDIWALGCAMYEMATGHLPFYDRPEYVVPKLWRAGERPPYPRDGDQGLWAVIQYCWSRECSRADDVITALYRDLNIDSTHTKQRRRGIREGHIPKKNMWQKFLELISC